MHQPDQKELAQIWAEVPPDYYYHLNFIQRLWHDWKWIIFQHLISIQPTQPKMVLEVGCAGGHLSGLLAKTFPRAKINGIDVYEPAIKEAKRRFPKIKFYVADAHKLPFRDNSVEMVLTSETIEHVIDPGKMLREIRRVLKPNGYAIIEMDSGNWLFRLIWFFWTKWGKGKVWKNAHLHPFSAPELEQVIKDSGLIINTKIVSHFGMAISFLVTKN